MKKGNILGGAFHTSSLTVVGLGLMGGSLALALRPHADTIIGVDPNPETLAYAKANGIIDVGTDDLREGVSLAETVILAAPVRVIVELLERKLVSFLRYNTLVIDIGSTKQEIVRAMSKLPIGIHAIGGHPMAGKEHSGIQHAEARILIGRPFVLTPTERRTPATLSRAVALVESIGAVPVQMDAARHDQTVATISHLPYIISSALVATTAYQAQVDPAVWQLASSGFRDTSRLASSDIKMMMDILGTNKQAVTTMLAFFRMQLAQLEALLISGDEVGLVNFLSAIRDTRNEWWLNQQKGAK